MARAPITVQTIAVPGDIIDETAPTGTGSGNGVEVNHSNGTPVVLQCFNRGVSPTTLTIVANGQKSKGITIPDQTLVVAADEVGAIWVAPDYYSAAGKLRVDASNVTDVTFAAFKTGSLA